MSELKLEEKLFTIAAHASFFPYSCDKNIINVLLEKKIVLNMLNFIARRL